MIFAPPLLAAETTAHYYRLARLGQLDQWWHWLVLVALAVAIVLYVAWMYRRDGVELSRGLALSLAVLRIAAFAGILVFFLGPEKRADREVTKTSRAVLLVDTSASMGLPAGAASSSAAQTRRIDQAVAELKDGTLLANLRQNHDVVVYRFDQSERPSEIATLPKFAVTDESQAPQAAAVARYYDSVQGARTALAVGAGILGVALLAWLVHVVLGVALTAGGRESWPLLVSVVALIAGVVVIGTAHLRYLEVPWPVMAGIRAPAEEDVAPVASGSQSDEEPLSEPVIDWAKELRAEGSVAGLGSETRIGDALRYLVRKERGGPIAGVVFVTDGGQNAGLDAAVALAEAQDANIRVYVVGLGSDERPQNVKLVDVEAPQRVYPGDEFNITAYVQGFGLKGADVDAKLYSGPADVAAPQLAEDAASTPPFKLGDDAEVMPVVFRVKPSEQGRRQYQVRLATRAKDSDAADNQRTVSVEVVDRKTKVLLFAGGPAREFRFLRNQLFRDKDTVVDVLLQSGSPEASQETSKLLTEFPKTEEELFPYDAIVAFDPDWESLDELQVKLMERWVAEKAGGLIVVAGPVHTSQWAGRRRGGDARFDTIKALYPVVFYTSASASLNLGRTGGESAWPLQFTSEGLEAEFLWLTDEPRTSEDAWKSFGGVYGYFAVKDPKPGAKVFARFADPETSIDNVLPIYLAGHFYGAGRVFFQASGEMWRVRSVDEAYFETYYTKLLRWVSQGRLMQDSTRGVLLVDKDRALIGEQVVVRAMLTNAQRQPLADPAVTLNLVLPDTTRKALSLVLIKEAPRPGTYGGQFSAALLGDYRLELRVPQSVENEVLSRQVRVDVPKREIERPERNDVLLRQIANETDGEYYVGFAAAESTPGRLSLAAALQPQDQTTTIPGTPDRLFDRLLMTWLMGLITGLLSLEWLLRRLSKLA